MQPNSDIKMPSYRLITEDGEAPQNKLKDEAKKPMQKIEFTMIPIEEETVLKNRALMVSKVLLRMLLRQR